MDLWPQTSIGIKSQCNACYPFISRKEQECNESFLCELSGQVFIKMDINPFSVCKGVVSIKLHELSILLLYMREKSKVKVISNFFFILSKSNSRVTKSGHNYFYRSSHEWACYTYSIQWKQSGWEFVSAI